MNQIFVTHQAENAIAKIKDTNLRLLMRFFDNFKNYDKVLKFLCQSQEFQKKSYFLTHLKF